VYTWTSRYVLIIIANSVLNIKLGTGKTHTLIEVIRQLTMASPSNLKANRVLVCGASNLSVDNILERLLALPVLDKVAKLKVTRIGHPARVMAHQGILDSTLEVKAAHTDQVSVTLTRKLKPVFKYQGNRPLSPKTSNMN